MDDGRPRDDDVAALEAVWGREASAGAPGPPRPDIDALLDVEAPGDDVRRRRPRRRQLVAGAVLAVVVVIGALVGAAAVLLDDDGPGGGRRSDEAAPADDAGRAAPVWSLPATCPRTEDVAGHGYTECPVVADDERAYVLLLAEGVPHLRALDAATGELRWERAFPEGARDVRRLPSVVLVTGVGAPRASDVTSETPGDTMALDPVTGQRLWGRPGVPLGAVGPDHVLFDHLDPPTDAPQSTMTVVEAATGRVVLARTGPAVDLFLHSCGEAGLVVASEGETLTAYDVGDGSARWSIDAPHLDLWNPLGCDARTLGFVDAGTLRLVDASTGDEIARTVVAPAGSDDGAKVLAIAGGTVVVGSGDGARGFTADAALEQRWRLRCRQCGSDLPTGPAGDDVVVLIGGEAVVRRGVDGASGPRLDLAGLSERRLEDGSLLAWGRGRLVVADPADLGRPVELEVDGMRDAAAGGGHVVVTTADEVRAYRLDG